MMNTLLRPFVTPSFSLPPTSAAIAMVNPLASPDTQVATWFHEHLTQTFVTILRALSEPGSSECIGILLFAIVSFFVWKRWWPSLLTLVVAVPGGMLLNEMVKLLVHRHRPYVDGAFVDWSGYSFASGHTIGATLLYGQLALFVLPLIRRRHRRALVIATTTLLVLLVGFSRIALGAHYLTDVLAAICFGSFWLMFCLITGRLMRRRSSESMVPPELLPVSSGEAILVPVAPVADRAQNISG
jgi:membrane-associated phospholipid phosphatase